MTRHVRPVHEPLAQQAIEPRILLDRYNAQPGVRKRFREQAVARARFDDEIASGKPRAANDRACDGGIAQEVLGEFGLAIGDPRIDATHDVPPAGWRRDVARDPSLRSG